MKEPKNGFENGRKITGREKNIYLITLSKHLNGETGKNSSIPNKSLQLFQRAVDLI